MITGFFGALHGDQPLAETFFDLGQSEDSSAWAALGAYSRQRLRGAKTIAAGSITGEVIIRPRQPKKPWSKP